MKGKIAANFSHSTVGLMYLQDLRILWTRLFVSIVFISIFFGANSQRPVQVVFESFRCFDLNMKYLNYMECRLKPHSKGKRMQSVYINASASQEMTNWTATIDVYMGARGKRRIAFKFQPDLCKEVASKQKNFLLKLFFEEFVKAFNIPPRCPLPKNVEFIARDFNVDVSLVPKYLPHVDWLGEAVFYSNGEKIVSARTEGYLGRRK